MLSVAFFNNKGGVGKTTLLCNLAAFLSREHQKKILVIDADPQTNATQYMFDDAVVDKIYATKDSFTVYSVAHPLSLGKGYLQLMKDNYNIEAVLFSRKDDYKELVESLNGLGDLVDKQREALAAAKLT